MALIKILHDLAAMGSVDVEHVNRLMAACELEQELDRSTVETMLAVDMVVRTACSEWDEFVKNAVVVHVVEENGSAPEDRLKWLVEAVSRNGLVDDHQRFDLLVRVIEALDVVPDDLVSLVLAQVERSIVRGDGPLAHAKLGETGVVSKPDVNLIRRILIGAEGREARPVSIQEMDFLFELNEQTLPSANHALWNDLVVKAMSNFVLGGHDAFPERRSVVLSAENNPDVDARSNLCIAHLRMVAHMTSRQSQAKLGGNCSSKKVPADWVVDRFRASGTFASDEVAMVDHLAQMATGKRSMGSPAALVG